MKKSPRIEFEGASYELRTGESMLDALVRGGANIPFSCRKGTCQICTMQLVSGDVGPAAVRGLRPDAVAQGMFLPCCAQPEADVAIARADPTRLSVPLHLAEKEWLSESICRLSFEPERTLDWAPGQFINLRRGDGLTRSYSITSIPSEDYFLTIHVKRLADGVMSRWLCDELEVGAAVAGQGPVGTCFYDPADRARDLLLLATGSGLSPLHGVVRDALRQGHTGQIRLYHGSRYADGLYLRRELQALAEQHPQFHYVASLTGAGPRPEGVRTGRIVELAFGDQPDLTGWVTYLCGIPDMVHDARCRAILAGVARKDIKADPFEYAHRYQPDDGAKLAGIRPDPELWDALERGPGLTRLLTRFYGLVYQDPRLSPFFRRVTKQRAIEQQYAFLADLFSGSKRFFGLKPFNAHHWMVISDELFDYREALMERIMREHGLAEHLIRRWSALHELFRREIVKSSARGLIVNGVEEIKEPPSDVVVDAACLCDGCQDEIAAGATARYHPDGGTLFCKACAAAPRALAHAG